MFWDMLWAVWTVWTVFFVSKLRETRVAMAVPVMHCSVSAWAGWVLSPATSRDRIPVMSLGLGKSLIAPRNFS